eukprot:403332780
MKTPLALLQQITYNQEFQVNMQENITEANQMKKSKQIAKQAIKSVKSKKQELCTKSVKVTKPKRLSQFSRQSQTSESPSLSPIRLMLSQSNILTPQQNETSRIQPKTKQSQQLLSLFKISSEKSSKRQQMKIIESEVSTNYDDDSQPIDESMRSMSNSSFLIRSGEKDLPDENPSQYEETSQTSDNLQQDSNLDKIMSEDDEITQLTHQTQSHTSYQTTDLPEKVTQIEQAQIPQKQTFQVKPIYFLPDVPSTQKILRGESVIFKDHYKEILMYYDIIPVSKSFIEGVTVSGSGPFYEIKPTQLDQFWAEKTIQYPKLASFINKNTQI